MCAQGNYEKWQAILTAYFKFLKMLTLQECMADIFLFMTTRSFFSLLAHSVLSSLRLTRPFHRVSLRTCSTPLNEPPPPKKNPTIFFVAVSQKLASSSSPPRVENPTTNGGMQNGSSVGIHTHCIHVFCTFGADFFAQSVLINKISASELSRKFSKTALLVGSPHFFLPRHDDEAY